MRRRAAAVCAHYSARRSLARTVAQGDGYRPRQCSAGTPIAALYRIPTITNHSSIVMRTRSLSARMCSRIQIRRINWPLRRVATASARITRETSLRIRAHAVVLKIRPRVGLPLRLLRPLRLRRSLPLTSRRCAQLGATSKFVFAPNATLNARISYSEMRLLVESVLHEHA